MENSQSHLMLRPRAAPLQRPAIDHPVLGHLEYVNRSGGWWQGELTLGRAQVRLDVNLSATPSTAEWDAAAELLQWLLPRESDCRGMVQAELAAGRAESNIDALRNAPLDLVPANLRPAKLALWPGRLDLEWEFVALPEAQLRGAHRLMLTLNGAMSLEQVFIYELAFDRRAEEFLERAVPAELADFPNSVADQFMVTAAHGRLKLDTERRASLAGEIEAIEQRVADATEAAGAYLTSALLLLKEIAATPTAFVIYIQVTIRIFHPEGKRTPVKKRFLIEPTDRARIEGSGRGSLVDLFQVSFEHDCDADFEIELTSCFQEAAAWLTRQSPTVFQELRDLGHTTDVLIYTLARMEEDCIEYNIPPEFLQACGMHNLGVCATTFNREEL